MDENDNMLKLSNTPFITPGKAINTTNKKQRELDDLRARFYEIKNFDASGEIKHNLLDCRTLLFESKSIVAGPVAHVRLRRDKITDIDLIEGSYQHYKL